MNYLYDEFVICPVREATDETEIFIKEYISEQEKKGKKIYWPKINTNQIDEIGARICIENVNALANSKEIKVFYDPSSKGSHFDIGNVFLLYFLTDKPISLINTPEDKEGKSFVKLINFLDKHRAEFKNGKNLESNILKTLEEVSIKIKEIYKKENYTG